MWVTSLLFLSDPIVYVLQVYLHVKVVTPLTGFAFYILSSVYEKAVLFQSSSPTSHLFFPIKTISSAKKRIFIRMNKTTVKKYGLKIDPWCSPVLFSPIYFLICTCSVITTVMCVKQCNNEKFMQRETQSL